MRESLLAILVLSSSCILWARQSHDPVSRSLGGVWLRPGNDPWVTLDAPSLLASAKGLQAGFAHYPAMWGLRSLGASAFAAAFPVSPGGVGIAITRFGGESYSETEAVVAWGMASGALESGVDLRLRHLSIPGYGHATTPRLDVAAALHLHAWLRCGIRVCDLNRGPVGRSGERLAQRVSVAVALHPPGLPALLVQADGEGEGGPAFRAGISLGGEVFTFRAGASGSFTRIHTGLSITTGRFTAGYGIVVHPVLGWSHSFWISTAWDA